MSAIFNFSPLAHLTANSWRPATVCVSVYMSVQALPHHKAEYLLL